MTQVELDYVIPSPEGAETADQTPLFIGGFHRSGTTALARAVAAHPDASGFHDTPARELEDEGQHLQTVYPDERTHGGAGRFALDPAPHLPRVELITYEALTRRPAETLADVGTWLGLDGPVPVEGIAADRSTAYEEEWHDLAHEGDGPAFERGRRLA